MKSRKEWAYVGAAWTGLERVGQEAALASCKFCVGTGPEWLSMNKRSMFMSSNSIVTDPNRYLVMKNVHCCRDNVQSVTFN
jgi:hypothetical protein